MLRQPWLSSRLQMFFGGTLASSLLHLSHLHDHQRFSHFGSDLQFPEVGALRLYLGWGECMVQEQQGGKMGSQSRWFRASEAVDSEVVYLCLFLFLCLGFLSRPADYGHTHQCAYRVALDLEPGLSETLNPEDISWKQMDVVALFNSSRWPFPFGSREDSPLWTLWEFESFMSEPSIEYNDSQDSGDLLDDTLYVSGGSFLVDFNPLSGRTLSQVYCERFKTIKRMGRVTNHQGQRNSRPLPNLMSKRPNKVPWLLHDVRVECTFDPHFEGNAVSEVDPQRRPWFMVDGMEQIEVVIDYKIPKGTSTELSLNLPSSAICVNSIPKVLLTLLRNETIETMGIVKKLGHVEECFNKTVVPYFDLGLLPDRDLELRTKVLSVVRAGIIVFVLLLIMARKRIRNVILFKSSDALDALILEESDLDESYLGDQILYENLLKDAELISSQGSSGKVLKVRFLELECAMKVFHSNARMDFRKESISLLNLSHPNVVKFFCIFRKSFIVMELMDEDLYSFITKIRERRIDYDMPLQVALDVMLQIAEAMSYLHHQGFAHQDLKSLNILLKLRGEFDAPDFQIIAKVADLGSARRFDPRYPEGFVLVPNMNIGTRSWRAPELFHPRGSSWTRFLGVNPRVLPKPLDIYGFAVICSELLTKQIPFSTDQDLRVSVLASKVREGHRPALPSTGCPEGLLTLIKDCWHGDPVLRPEFHEVCTRLTEVRSWMSRGQSSES